MERRFSRIRTRTGFTLAELLAVIVIMASLAAIIYPIFPKAIDATKRVSCVMNLKQIGVGLALYTGEYDDRYPYSINEIERAIPLLPLGEDQKIRTTLSIRPMF